jgi:hypothetical protein
MEKLFLGIIIAASSFAWLAIGRYSAAYMLHLGMGIWFTADCACLASGEYEVYCTT